MSATTTTQAPALTADNIIHLVPEVNTHLASNHQRRDSAHNDLEGYDEEQIRLMDEVCIVLDENDKPIGSASKKVCESHPHIQPRNPHINHNVFACAFISWLLDVLCIAWFS